MVDYLSIIFVIVNIIGLVCFVLDLKNILGYKNVYFDCC